MGLLAARPPNRDQKRRLVDGRCPVRAPGQADSFSREEDNHIRQVRCPVGKPVPQELLPVVREVVSVGAFQGSLLLEADGVARDEDVDAAGECRQCGTAGRALPTVDVIDAFQAAHAVLQVAAVTDLRRSIPGAGLLAVGLVVVRAAWGECGHVAGAGKD